MKSDKKIPPAEWMIAAPTRAVMYALNDSGVMQTLFVGGCVRNELLGLPVSDIDLATVHTPDEVIARLQKAGIRHIPTGLDHGTVTALVQGQHFEITTLRRDVETDGRHAVVSYTDDWREDAQRRDFTMNTLLADESGNMYDPLGQGLNDLNNKRVIFVGKPADRIAEDYLRILRFFRFHTLYGSGVPDAEALSACREAADHISSLSRERIAQEMIKILSADNAADTLSLMFAHNGVLSRFDQPLFSSFCALQVRHNATDVMARLVLLADMNCESAAQMMLLSGAQFKAVKALAQAYSEIKNMDEKNIRQLIYKYSNDVMRQIILLRRAQGDTLAHRELFDVADTWNPPKFPLAGQDAIDLGITPGPVLGQLLADVEAWWLAQDFVPDRDACLQQLQLSAQAQSR